MNRKIKEIIKFVPFVGKSLKIEKQLTVQYDVQDWEVGISKQNEVNAVWFSAVANAVLHESDLSSVSICSGEALVGFQRGDVGKNVRHILKGAGSTPARYAKAFTANLTKHQTFNLKPLKESALFSLNFSPYKIWQKPSTWRFHPVWQQPSKMN